MSILLIMLLAFFLALGLGLLVGASIDCCTDSSIVFSSAMGVFVLLVCFICLTLIGVESSKNSEIAYVEGYKAQKATIEQSLKNESLTGLERFDLVKQAGSLNQELGERKAKSEYGLMRI